MPVSLRLAEMEVIFDDRYFPLLISTWTGRADLEAAKWHQEHHRAAIDRAVSEGLRVVSISMATRTQRPTPEVRKYWADSMSKTPAAHRAATLATFVVMTSAMMRGVMTAIGWLNEEARSIKTYPTLSSAIREGLALLEAEGLECPAGLDPDAYALPPSENGRSSA